MKYPVLQVCESLCPSASVSLTSRCMLTPTVESTHMHRCTTLPRHLKLIQELQTEPSSHIHLPQAHLPSHSIPPAAPHHWRKKGDSLPPAAPFLCLGEFLCFHPLPSPYPCPASRPGCAQPSLGSTWASWVGISRLKPVQPFGGMELESQTLGLSPHSASLTGIYMVDQMGCFPVFCEKMPRTPFIFLPLKGFWFITQNEFSRWHQPVRGSRCVWPPGVRWDRSVLRPNSSVSLSKSLLLTKPLFSCEENGSDGTCSKGGEMALFHLKGSGSISVQRASHWVQTLVLWNLPCRVLLPVLGSQEGFEFLWGNRESPASSPLGKGQTVFWAPWMVCHVLSAQKLMAVRMSPEAHPLPFPPPQLPFQRSS